MILMPRNNRPPSSVVEEHGERFTSKRAPWAPS